MTDGPFPVAGDIAAAVTRLYESDEAAHVLQTLAAVDSDRVQVAVLVGAAIKGGDLREIEALATQATLDYRDVVMVEYDARVDYAAELKRLGLERPYPVR